MSAGQFWLLMAVVVGCSVVLVIWVQNERRNAARAKITALIQQHQAALGRRRRQTLRVDDYGNVIADAWVAEIKYFLDKVVTPALTNSERKVLDWDAVWVGDAIEKAAFEEHKSRAERSEYSDDLDPTEFEHHCANVLERDGWDARVTKASGDQGVDVIAERDSIRVVLQCKKYSGVVGNKAVQEVFAAKSHEDADYAAVVTNSSFSKSAKQLAATTGVILLHVDDLPDLWSIVQDATAA